MILEKNACSLTVQAVSGDCFGYYPAVICQSKKATDK